VPDAGRGLDAVSLVWRSPSGEVLVGAADERPGQVCGWMS